MKITIALIVSPPVYRHIQEEILSEIETYCDVVLEMASTTDEAFALYERLYSLADAFIFSGSIYMYPVSKRAGALKKPMFAFTEMTADIRDTLLRLLLKDRNFDFSRTLVDVASEENNYIGIKEILPPEQWPYFLDVGRWEHFSVLDGDAASITEHVFEQHLALHRAGKIDLSITRFGALVQRLEAAGFPCVYLLPSKESIINFVLQVINSQTIKTSREQMISAIAIFFRSGLEQGGRELMRLCANALMGYAGQNSLDFSVSRNGERLEVITRYKDLEKMTNGFTDMSFCKEIGIPIDNHIFFGMGAGYSILQARQHAISASDIAPNDNSKIYFIGEDNRVLGPLGNSPRSVKADPTEAVVQLARHFHIDYISLQKIVAYTQVGGSDTVTAEGLANYLGITPRSANRLMAKVVAGGAAVVTEGKPGSGRGRPKRFYKLTFPPHLSQDNTTKQAVR